MEQPYARVCVCVCFRFCWKRTKETILLYATFIFVQQFKVTTAILGHRQPFD